MSRSYIVIYPANPLLPKPNKDFVINQLKSAGFLAQENMEWLNPKTNEMETYFRPGINYIRYVDFNENINEIEEKLKNTLIEYKEYDEIEAEFYASGKFQVINPITGTNIGEEWGNELGDFLEDNNHQYLDPVDNRLYYFFELECNDIALGKYFITIEDGWGEPNQYLLDLMEQITEQKHKWMWAKI